MIDRNGVQAVPIQPIRLAPDLSKVAREPSKPIRLAGDKSRCKVAATVASTKSITTSSEKSEVPEKHHESNETTQTDTEKVGTSRSFKPWEEAIINAYIENGGSQSAAFRIGKPNCLKWTDKSVHNKAHQFFNRGEVKATIEKRTQALFERLLVTLDDITRGHLEVYRRRMQATPVLRKGEPVLIETESGEIAAAYTFQAMAALKALDQLGRHLGWYESDNVQKSLDGRSVLIEFFDAVPVDG